MRLFDVEDPDHGIVHIAGPHLGFALPGCTYVCGDSHTATCGGIGAWAWGIGTTEVMQVFAAQALVMRKPRTLRAEFHGTPPRGIYAKDMILALIGRHGVDAGVGHVVQYAGPAIRTLPIRRTAHDLQHVDRVRRARGGLIAADDASFEYLHGRAMAPKGPLWDQAMANWRTLYDERDAQYDRVISINASELERPQVTWGNSPQDVVTIEDAVP